MLAIDPVAETAAVIADVTGVIADTQSTISAVEGAVTVIQSTSGHIQAVLSKIQATYSFLKSVAIYSYLVMFFMCFVNSLIFIKELFFYSGKFFTWFGVKFIPWFSHFIVCAIEKLFSLPKCFLWYGLDVVGRILYLPVRFLWYVIDTLFQLNGFFEKIEHDIWCFLDDIDHFIHDEEGLNTGMHLIHFPDSVMAKCYKCNFGEFPSLPNSSALLKAFTDMMSCVNRKM